MRPNQSRGSWIITVPLVAVGVGYLYLVFLPAKQQIDKLRKDLSEERMFVSQEGTLKGSIAALEELLTETDAFVGAWKKRAVRPADLSQLFGEINRRAKSAGTTLDNFDPQATVDFELVRKVPLRLSVHGSFAQLQAMLRSFEQLPSTVWVESLALESNRDADKPLKAEVILAVFTANPDISD
jgi:Tfp pilus assembly protein PilO